MRLFKFKKAYDISQIPWLAITFGIGVIVLSVVSQIVGEVKSTQCTWNSTINDCAATTGGSTEASNITTKGALGLSKVANWLPTIGLVVGAVIVITALSVLFVMRFRKEE